MSKTLVSHPVSHPLPVPSPSSARQLLVPLLALLIILILCATPLTITAAGTPYATPSGSTLYATPTGTGDCLTWANACTLQTALTGAVASDEIWVKAGIHKPTTANDRTATFTLVSGVAVYGGFDGTETLRSERDPVANVTVLSGDIDNNDVVDANGVVTSTVNIAGSNSYHVTTGSGTNSSALLDGVTVTAGAAESSTPHHAGGGMLNNSGSPTLTNVTFSGNRAGDGGGMANDNGSPTLTNVTFNANSTGQYFGLGHNGGGMLNGNGSSPTLTNVTFVGNSAPGWWGGGIYNFSSSSSPTLSNVTFSGNSADEGGGMYSFFSSPTLTNVTFSSNSAAKFGGGMYNNRSSPTLSNVTFSANSAFHYGGGMINDEDSNATLTNVAFSGNSAGTNAAGMYNSYSNPTLTNVTFSGNRAGAPGGALFNNSSSPLIRNTIFWNNQDSSGVGTAAASIVNSSTSSIPSISHSLVQNCFPGGLWTAACGADGGNNLPDADPLFFISPNPAAAPSVGGNLHLQSGSPAIDAGNSAVTDPALPAFDLDGGPRIIGAAVDLGPYEAPLPGVRYAAPSAAGAADCTSWANVCTLHFALAAAGAGDEIWVQAGVHKPTTIADRNATFLLENGLPVYGGFAGVETLRSERDPVANVTVLSGDIDNNDTVDANGVVTTAANIAGSNSYHVVTGSGSNSTALLDGFTITAGNANGASFPNYAGGGMLNYSGSPTLSNVTFSGNSAASAPGWGGGMYNLFSSPDLTNIVFTGNSAKQGGGMYSDRDSPTLTNVTFSGNSATEAGGGMFNNSSSPTLTNVTFSGNSVSASAGGGMYNVNASSPLIRNTIFWNNQADGTVATVGASVYNIGGSIPTISHSLVQGCYPGGLWTAACGTNGGNNLSDADPLFVTTPNPADAPSTGGNLRLQASSPAIDDGDDSVASAIDLDGTPRIQGDAVDLGPYEYGDATCTTPIVPTVTIELTGALQTDVRLSWAVDPANNGYKVYRSPQPYFDPAATIALVSLPAGTTSYTDLAVVDSAAPTYYIVRGVSNCGILSTWQTPLGQFAFALTPGQ